MKKFLIAMCAAALLVSTIGCANGPIRQWFRGAPCNTCNPQIRQPLNVAPPCNSGCAENAVGTGILGRLFRGNQSQPVANCGTGTCNAPMAQMAPASMPASNFIGNGVSVTDSLPLVIDSSPSIGPAPGEMYGNTNTVGRLEMPPMSFNNN